jgi:hydrogenase maturation protease
MTQTSARCLILACGNTLRSDDGVGPWLAAWAEEKFAAEPDVVVIARQQWTPDLAEDIARAESVLFIDCSIASAPGSVNMVEVQPCGSSQGLATHHVGAAELLGLASELFDSLPRTALILTIGAGSTELGETFSRAVREAIPKACELLEQTVFQIIREQD